VEVGLHALIRVRPPRVHIELVSADAGVTVTVQARAPDADNPDQQLKRAELWIEDHRYAVWDATGKAFVQTVQIPASALRSGANQLTFQCYNAAGGSAEAMVNVQGAASAGLPDLYGLVVGVADYQNARVPGGRPENLKHTTEDARALRAAWL